MSGCWRCVQQWSRNVNTEETRQQLTLPSHKTCNIFSLLIPSSFPAGDAGSHWCCAKLNRQTCPVIDDLASGNSSPSHLRFRSSWTNGFYAIPSSGYFLTFWAPKRLVSSSPQQCRLAFSPTLTRAPDLLFALPWIWRQHVSANCRYISNRMHDVTPHKLASYTIPWRSFQV